MQDVSFIGRYRMCRGAAYRLQGDGRNEDMSEFLERVLALLRADLAF